MEVTLTYNSQHIAKFEFPAMNWRSGFCFGFCKKEKHWLTWLPVTQKLRRTVLKKVNTEWQEKKIQSENWELYKYISSTKPPLLNPTVYYIQLESTLLKENVMNWVASGVFRTEVRNNDQGNFEFHSVVSSYGWLLAGITELRLG